MAIEASLSRSPTRQTISRSPATVRSCDVDTAEFLRARDILRQEGPLGIEQFFEIDALFRRVTRAQLQILTEDERHQRQLRSYEALSWRQGFPILVVMIALLAAILVAGSVFLFAR